MLRIRGIQVSFREVKFRTCFFQKILIGKFKTTNFVCLYTMIAITRNHYNSCYIHIFNIYVEKVNVYKYIYIYIYIYIYNYIYIVDN